MGLYDDEKAGTTSGDIFDVIYWQTKFAYLKFGAALKSRQPESAIKGIIPGIINGCDDLLKTYPNHEDVKKWRAEAIDTQAKIDPNAPPADFKANFAQWKDFSYESGWRFYNLSKMAAQTGDWTWAYSHAGDAETHLTRAIGRMAQWPEDVQAWIKSALEEMVALKESAAKKK